MLLQDAYKVGFERKVFEPFGIPLQPLTLGHVQLLAELGVEIVWSNARIKAKDLACILAVCCFSHWQQAREELFNAKHIASMSDVVMKGNPHDSQAVVDYLVYYLDRPASRGLSDPMEARIPWWWSYAEFLQTELGRDEEDAWDTICSDAFCYYSSYATRNGSEQFLTGREYYLESMVKKGYTMKQLFEEGLI